MKALIFDGTPRLVENYPVPVAETGEALIRTLLAGICDTDLQIVSGYMDFRGVLGHEFTGIVEQVNAKDQGLKGKRVVGVINCGCGTCQFCTSGLERHCPHRKTLGIDRKDGTFAQYITLPARNLLEVPARISDEEAVFAEPLAAAFEILEQLHIKPSQEILIMGDGKMGLLTAQTLQLTGAGVTILGKHHAKLGIASELGIAAVQRKNFKGEKSFDIVVDATGHPESLVMAMHFVKPGGTIILKTTTAHNVTANFSPLVINEITLMGSRCGPFEPALAALSSGSIRVKPLLTAIYPFKDTIEAMKRASQQNSLKVLIDFREDAEKKGGR